MRRLGVAANRGVRLLGGLPSLVSLFFDAAWWQEHLGGDPPGFLDTGAGTGLPLTAIEGSKLGYAQKGVRIAGPA